MVAAYARSFAKLRTHVSRSRWSEITNHRAPHKPLLLLTVLDLFERGDVEDNLIELSPDLGELFGSYWERVVPLKPRGNLGLPFFHLRSEGFWHLVPRPSKEGALADATQIRSLVQLRDTVTGARLNENLYGILQDEVARGLLRAVLVETYFAPEVHPKVIEQGQINVEAFRYSKRLLEGNWEKVEEALAEGEGYRPAARDQGFRRAVVTAYAHRCALCGIRMLTLDGHTAVDASHIVPWSISHDDRPANGMALCRLCHWAFDEGLLGVSTQYVVVASSQLTMVNNLPGHLSNLEGRGIVGPAEKSFWPDPDSLEWHHKKVFRASDYRPG